jgi:hypothetical protein
MQGGYGHAWRRTPALVPKHTQAAPQTQHQQHRLLPSLSRARAPLHRYLQQARARNLTPKKPAAQGEMASKAAARLCASYCKCVQVCVYVCVFSNLVFMFIKFLQQDPPQKSALGLNFNRKPNLKP